MISLGFISTEKSGMSRKRMCIVPNLVRLAQIVEDISTSNTEDKYLKINEVFINFDNVLFLEDDLTYKKRASESSGWPPDLDNRISITKIYFNAMPNSKNEHIYVLGDALSITEKLGV